MAIFIGIPKRLIGHGCRYSQEPGSLFTDFEAAMPFLFPGKKGAMDEKTFKQEMAMAKTLWDTTENKDYWHGYIRGLRRRFYGEIFATDEEHEKWMSMINDEYWKELGRGYRDGYNYSRDCQNNPI